MFLDTSVVVELLRHEKDTKRFNQIYALIAGEQLFISMVQLAELSDWCISNAIDPRDCISKLKDILNIVPLTEEVCLKASELKRAARARGCEKFGLMDGLVLASALSLGEKLLTLDTDFEGLENVMLLE